MGLDGKENKNTERIRKFVEELKLEVDIPIEFFDERFSSQQADAMGGGVSRDEKAAMVVLQSYLGSHST
jgi:RNase H-fold protein (predicted Holliday junction resolvase)